MICPYCGKEAKWCNNEEIYGKRYGKSYKCYYCKDCNAYVGCHNNSRKSLGTMADKELRLLRRECHKLFDIYWWDKESRKCAYDWLRDKMVLGRHEAHIGKLDIRQCKKLLELLNKEK